MLDQDNNNNSNPEEEEAHISDEKKDESKQKEDEHMRLGGHTPLATILRLSPGPLISQIVNSLYGVIDSMWVTRFIGEVGLTALSVAYVIDNTALSFGYFVSTAASSEISYLLSNKAYDKINQVTADLFRICIMIGMLIPAILFPSSKPLFRFLDAGDEVIKKAFDYVIPLLSLNVVTCFYHCVCGVLQAEGRTWTYGGAQIASMILNMVLWDPILLYLLKRTIGSSLATEIAMFIPGFIILILIFCHKFAAKPTFKLFKNCFIIETWEAVKIGLSALIMNISVVVPTLVMQKFIAIRANKINQYDMVIAVFNALTRLYQLTLCIPMALNAAYLPATSYAFGLNNKRRVLWLTWHVLWIGVTWGIFVMIIISIWPGPIAKIWSSHPDFQHWAKEMLPVSFYTIPLCTVKFIVISFLQATKQATKAMITSIVTELVSLPVFACCFHYIGNNDSPTRIIYAYIVNDLFSTAVCLCVSGTTFFRFFKDIKNGNTKDEFPMKEIVEEDDDDSQRVIPEI
ncbi:MatE family protein [Trichomonas vaginalis G3]|uniref:MatE family protein n=1 Tax=Trichomonas vaginalis (strain ATCC PRA-98 / G3) TaxID=412133 RepID=A2EZN8_TRIV3|nr:multidrug resistance protein YPNP-related family [Trichomonas vaginalis G3]EAY01876.1 MatE family protein [Trichomonas vaginalis G3]KAI5549675.1 multidrug resistance protein YPNP-related family [Trichomonas vaginalis G3]|eukprot:XP_001314420.1 MatE family protein [Trichomonas vaginalis G3]